MAKTTKTKIKDLIDQEIKNLENEHADEKDEEYTPRFIESPTKMDAEERVIDELLASVPKNQGYYLKLSKEIRPNEFELKLRVDNYDAWSDLEWEITNLVRSYTLKSPQKWGSGHYRVIIWREGGVRGPKFRPIDFYIDAQELENNVNANVNSLPGDIQDKVKEQFASFSELMKTMQMLNPVVPPAEIQNKIFDAFKSGMDAKTQSMQTDAVKDVASQQSMHQVLLELIRQKNDKPQGPSTDQVILTQLIQALTTQNTSKPKEEKDPLDIIIKLKEAGLINQPVPQVDGITKAFEIINTMLPMMQGLSGGGAGESTIGTIIKTVGPQISKIIGDVTGTINKAIDAKLTVNKHINTIPTHSQVVRDANSMLSNEHEEEVPMSPYDNIEMPMHETEHVNVQHDMPRQQQNNNGGDMEYVKFLNNLKHAIQTNDPNFYPMLEDALLSVTSEENYEKLINGETPVELAAAQIIRFGGKQFGSPQAIAYYNSFLAYVRNQRSNEYTVKCPQCGEDNVYASQEYFNTLTSESEDAHCINCNASLLTTSGV